MSEEREYIEEEETSIDFAKIFKDLTPEEFSWVLYDVGNSAFTMLACSLIPIWFKDLAIGTAPGQINGDQATAYYSIAISIVTVVVALIGPLTGALADHKDRKKIFFISAMINSYCYVTFICQVLILIF